MSQLYGRHPGSDIYIVGTGASLRVFPLEFLQDKITVGLNLAWRMTDVVYGITIHPELNIPEFLPDGDERPEITWITKHEKLCRLSSEQTAQAEAKCYFFRSDGQKNTSTNGQSNAGRIPDWVRSPDGDFLYLYSSISTAAVNLAAHMGAKNIFLVGCDNGAVAGNHHSHLQHTAWLGATPEQRYHDYFEGLAEVRTVLAERGIRLLSLTPFLSIGPHEEDFLRLCTELDVPPLLQGQDVTDVHWSRPSRIAMTKHRIKTFARRYVSPRS